MKFLRRWTTGHPTCKEIAEVLQSYLDGEADTDTAARVAMHLSECNDCSFEAETLEKIKNALSRLRRETDLAALTRLEEYLREIREGEHP
jgi:anti-sigma factor RsiW